MFPFVYKYHIYIHQRLQQTAHGLNYQMQFVQKCSLCLLSYYFTLIELLCKQIWYDASNMYVLLFVMRKRTYVLHADPRKAGRR